MKNICHNFYRKIIFNASALIMDMVQEVNHPRSEIYPGSFAAYHKTINNSRVFCRIVI